MSHPLELEWGTSAQTILDAVYHAKGYTKRGLRGIVAECEFRNRVLSQLPEDWAVTAGGGNDAVDFLLSDSGQQGLRVQVKMQRMQDGKPLIDRSGNAIVECQKSQGQGSARAYQYGEFDILAVSLWPLTQDWSSFIYAALHHLPHMPRHPKAIKKMQPIPLKGDEIWTTNLALAISRAAGHQAIIQTHKQLCLAT